MTTLLDRPPAGPPEAPAAAGPVAALVAAVRAALLGFVFVTVVVLLAWGAEPDGSAGTAGALRMAVLVWLGAHHTAFEVSGHSLAIVPLGLMVLPGGLLFRAGILLGRAAPAPARAVPLLRQVGVLTGAYALVVAVAAAGVAGPGLRPQPVSALGWAAALAAVAGGLGAVRGSGSWPRLRAAMPPTPRAVLSAGVLAAAVLVAAGALLAVAAVLVYRHDAGHAVAAYHAGVAGQALLVALGVLMAPNVAVWGAAYLAGPGFAVGTGTTVTAFGVTLGALPSLPWLDVLPTPGTPPGLLALLLGVPLLAGALAGILVARRVEVSSSEDAALRALLAGPVAGAVLAGLAWISGGSLAGGRLAAVGPSPWQVGLTVALEVAVAGAVAAWVTDRLRTRR